MKKERRQTTRKPTLSRAKRMTFALAALLLPIALLLAAEGVLRWVGYGGYDPVLRIAGDVDQGKLVISDQAGAISYFYANPSRPGYNHQHQFIDHVQAV